MGGKAYSLLQSLTAPDKLSGKQYDEIVKLTQAHLSPKPLVIAERFRIHKRNQTNEETIVAYVYLVFSALGGCWPPPGLPFFTGPVRDFHRQDI